MNPLKAGPASAFSVRGPLRPVWILPLTEIRRVTPLTTVFKKLGN